MMLKAFFGIELNDAEGFRGFLVRVCAWFQKGFCRVLQGLCMAISGPRL